jgi:hypothetical protein
LGWWSDSSEKWRSTWVGKFKPQNCKKKKKKKKRKKKKNQGLS